MFYTFTLVLNEVCVHCRIWLFSLGPVFYASLLMLGIFWMILRWYQLPILLLVSILFLHSTYMAQL